MKKTGFNGYLYDFSVVYDATDVDDIKDIHRYLMKNNNIMQMKIFGFVKKVFFVGLTILSGFTNTILLSCISRIIKSLKQDPKLLMLMEMNLCFSI